MSFILCFRANGQVTINTTIPDTITSWVASAFAVNSQTGLGVAPSTAKVKRIHLSIRISVPKFRCKLCSQCDIVPFF